MAIRVFSRNRTRRTGTGALAVMAALAVIAVGDAAAAATRYRVVSDASELRILAYRAGPLASLGHNHVVVTRALSGSILLGETVGTSSVRLEFPVASLEVDDPDLRAAEGPAFEGSIPPDDIAATRMNMLGPKLLDADSYPVIRIESTFVEGDLPTVTISARVAISGSEHPLEVPASVNTFDGGLVAVGRLRLAHSAIGLEPFSAALGTLRVAEQLQLSFRVVARTGDDTDRPDVGSRHGCAGLHELPVAIRPVYSARFPVRSHSARAPSNGTR